MVAPQTDEAAAAERADPVADSPHAEVVLVARADTDAKRRSRMGSVGAAPFGSARFVASSCHRRAVNGGARMAVTDVLAKESCQSLTAMRAMSSSAGRARDLALRNKKDGSCSRELVDIHVVEAGVNVDWVKDQQMVDDDGHWAGTAARVDVHAAAVVAGERTCRRP